MIGGANGPRLNKRNEPLEINFVDIDEMESDQVYLQNAFNYHTNKHNFWQKCIFDKIKLIQKIKETNPDLNLVNKGYDVFAEILVPN